MCIVGKLRKISILLLHLRVVDHQDFLGLRDRRAYKIPQWTKDQSKGLKSTAIVCLSNQRTPITNALWDDFL